MALYSHVFLYFQLHSQGGGDHTNCMGPVYFNIIRIIIAPCQPISSIRIFNIFLQGLSSPMGQVCQFWLNLMLKLPNNSLIEIWCRFVSSRYVFPQVVGCTRHWSDVPAIRFLHLKWFYVHSIDVTTSRYILIVRRNMEVCNRNVSSNIWLIHMSL